MEKDQFRIVSDAEVRREQNKAQRQKQETVNRRNLLKAALAATAVVVPTAVVFDRFNIQTDTASDAYMSWFGAGTNFDVREDVTPEPTEMSEAATPMATPVVKPEK